MTGDLTNPAEIGSLIVGKYRVERVLGAGGMGTVVAARHVDLDEVRAIKLMNEFEGDTTSVVERFKREARAAARLRSEHVAKVYDVGQTEGGVPFIVMEYLEGADLSYVARRRGPLPIGEVTSYIIQACDAVAEAHALGVIHRDLKPANLFLTLHDDGVPCIKVLDFGISKNLGSVEMDMTTTQDVLGSPSYMSPEQMRSTRAVDVRSDIWALGVILYRLITGKLPFPAGSPMELCAKILETVPPPPSALRPEVPPELDALILRCLEKDADRRVQSAEELAAALLPFAQLVKVEAMPMSRRLHMTAARTFTPVSGVSGPHLKLIDRVAVDPATTGPWGAAGLPAPARGRSRRDLMLGVLLGAFGFLLGLFAFVSWRGSDAPAAAGGPVPRASASPAVVVAPVAPVAPLEAPVPVVVASSEATEKPAPGAAITSARAPAQAPPKKARAAGGTTVDPFGKSRK